MQQMMMRTVTVLAICLATAFWGQSCDGPGLSPECIAIKNAEAGKCEGVESVTTEALEARDASDVALLRAPACQRIQPSAKAEIFIGRVISIDKKDAYMLLDGKCEGISRQQVKVEVQERFSGRAQSVVTVHAGDINGFYFSRNPTSRNIYLIVAKRNVDGSLSVSGLGGTKPLEDAREDIAFLRSWHSRPEKVFIYGDVAFYESRSRSMVPVIHPIAKRKVILEGPTRTEVFTNNAGQYRASNLLPGRYSLKIDSLSTNIQTINVRARGCAEINFHMESNHLPK